MNYLILGGTGFLGTALSGSLAKAGDQVRVYSPSASRNNYGDGITGVTGLIGDQGELLKQTAWCDVVVHLVSTTNPRTSFSDVYHDVSSNLLPMVQLLEILKDSGKKIIFCSSGGTVYGPAKQLPINEDHPRHPVTPYGLVKSAMEEYIHYYHINFGLPYLVVRPANVYGPKLRSIGEQGIISTLLFNALHQKETTLWANPDNIRDYVFIDDFVSALMSLIRAGAQGIYNIGSGKGYSLNEIIEAAGKVLGEQPKVHFTSQPIRDEASNVLDIAKINHLTGWLPVVTLEQGIRSIHSVLTQKKS